MKKILFNWLLFCVMNSFSQLNPIVDSIPMRDGKKLAADIYLPAGADQSYPVILIKTPYNRQLYRYNLPLKIGQNLASQPYAFVIVDWRCFYGSQNACTQQIDRGKDGYDVVEWIAQQPWCNGNIGMWGPSALGRIQYWTARENPPHLKCIVPIVAAPQFNYQQYYPGGVYRTEYVQQLDNLGFGLSTFILSHQYYDNVWQYLENYHFYPQNIKIPVFMIGGWYDHSPDEMITFFNALKIQSHENVRNKHKLLLGPWVHGGFGPSQVGTIQQGQLYYPTAAFWNDSLALKFFDFYLRNIQNGWEHQPDILYFQMGENNWKVSSTWPTNETTNYKLYFSKDRSLKSYPDTGQLVYLEYVYDPADPSPTIGGPTLRPDLQQGPYDQAPIVESRNDVLSFSTPQLQQDVVMKGKAKVKLFASSNTLDTDFAVRLTDVYPDGRSMLVVDGIKRARLRNGYSVNDTSFIVPGNIFEIEIELPNTAITFLRGHKIRVNISSSNYPRFDNNLNNGGNMYVAGDTIVATNRIYCTLPFASHIELPLVSYSSIESSSIFNVNENYVSPNPTDKFIYINTTFAPEEYEIYSILGELVSKGKFSNEKTVDVESLSKGIYIIFVNGKEYRDVFKFVKD